jgi:cytochrome P450
MGMTAPLLSRHEDIYPKPFEFRPERFIENPRLNSYQLTFSRGSRSCIGVSKSLSTSENTKVPL